MLFLAIRGFFYSKRIKIIQTIKITIVFDAIPFNNADSIITEDNAIFVCFKSLKE